MVEADDGIAMACRRAWKWTENIDADLLEQKTRRIYGLLLNRWNTFATLVALALKANEHAVLYFAAQFTANTAWVQ